MCAQNKIRIYTAEKMFSSSPHYQVRSRGVSRTARVKLTAGDIGWADIIFVMEKNHKTRIVNEFREKIADKKIVCLFIEDIYVPMENALIEELRCKLAPYLQVPKCRKVLMEPSLTRNLLPRWLERLIFGLISSPLIWPLTPPVVSGDFSADLWLKCNERIGPGLFIPRPEAGENQNRGRAIQMKSFDPAVFRKAIATGRIQWRKHVLQKLAERGIPQQVVRDVLLQGEQIREYADDKPFPSALFLGYVSGRPLHVVAAFDEAGEQVFVITAYEPSLEVFEPDFRTKRKL